MLQGQVHARHNARFQRFDDAGNAGHRLGGLRDAQGDPLGVGAEIDVRGLETGWPADPQAGSDGCEGVRPNKDATQPKDPGFGELRDDPHRIRVGDGQVPAPEHRTAA